MAYTDVIIARGPHRSPRDGACILETELLLAGYGWTTINGPDDLPECFSRALGAYVIDLNDVMPDAERQKLKVFLGRLAGTRGTREEECARAECLVMLGAKPAAVSALHSAGLHDHAGAVAAATTLAELESAAAEAGRAARAMTDTAGSERAAWAAARAAEEVAWAAA
ncbi:MAG: hypothetical protein OEZ19_00830, partial [Paracoccaceae bacterium]|nr:hypothetical protein [Paracoccaceae bacterium]